MTRLFGRWYISVDTSRRITLPVEATRRLESLGISSFMVGTPAQLRCIWLIPTAEWPEAEAALQLAMDFHILDEGPASQYARLCGSSWDEVRLSEKRIAFDESVLRWARLDARSITEKDRDAKSTTAVLVAMGRRLELWHPDEFEKQITRSAVPPAGVTLAQQSFAHPEAPDAADGSTRQS